MLEIFKLFGCVIATIILIYIQKFTSILAEPEYSYDGYDDNGNQLEVKHVASIWIKLLNLFLSIFCIVPLFTISYFVLEIQFVTSMVMSIIITVLFMLVTSSAPIEISFYGIVWMIKSLFNKETNISMVIKKNAKRIPVVDLRNEKNLKINKKFRQKYFYTTGFCLPKDFIIEENVFEDYGHYLIIICDKSKVDELKKMNIKAHIVSHDEFDETGWTLQQYVKRIEFEDNEMRRLFLDNDNEKIMEFVYLSRWIKPIDCTMIWKIPKKIKIKSLNKEFPGFIARFEEDKFYDFYTGTSSKREIYQIDELEFCNNILSIKEICFDNLHIKHLIFAKSIENIEDFRILGETSIDKVSCSSELKEILVPILDDKTKIVVI